MDVSADEPIDQHELGALVGRWAVLRPADASAVVRPGSTTAGSTSGGTGSDFVEVAVVSSLDRVLRCETRDRRAVALAGRLVLVEFGASEAMLRATGTVRVLVDRPLPVVLAVSVPGAIEHLQRRQWVRARVTVPVELQADATHGGGTVRTTTVDLSGGGARIRLVDAVAVGEEVCLVLWLPDGPVEVHGVVLEDSDGQTARVAFAQVAEAVSKKLVRFVFDIQVRQHRLVDP